MSEVAQITGGGPADQLLTRGLLELRPVLGRLGESALLIGGLMTRLWLQARPIDIPARATADVDLGIDRRGLGITGDQRLVRPLLQEAGFHHRTGDDEFRFVKEIDGQPFVVDLLVPSGSSRKEPPEIEDGLASLAAPGLAFARRRKATPFDLDLGGDQLRVYLPKLDAAFVLKGSLVGMRRKPSRHGSDSVDAMFLAAACANDAAAIEALREHRRRADVKAALRWLSGSVSPEGSASSVRVARYLEAEAGIDAGGEWARSVARQLLKKVG